jgi:hypothetical protein
LSPDLPLLRDADLDDAMLREAGAVALQVISEKRATFSRSNTPARFQRPDGLSRFRSRGLQTYTTQTLLDAGARLLDAGRSKTGPALFPEVLADLATKKLPGKAHPLSPTKLP